MKDSVETILADAKAVEQSIGELAQRVLEKYRDEDPLFVCLLRGAVPFAVCLMRAIANADPTFHPELEYMRVTTYGDGRETGEPRIVDALPKSTEITGRAVILLDDTLDSGVTAQFVSKHLLQQGARSVDLVVLVEKDRSRADFAHATMSCFHSDGDAWLIGMGLDDSSQYREAYRFRDYISVV